MKRFLAFLKLLAVAWTIPIATVSAALEGQLELSVVDRDTGKPLAVRVHLVNVATKKPVKPPGVPFLGDYFIFYDKLKLKLPLGSYQFTMERGPEYLVRTGHFTINNYADDRKTVDLKRFTDMASEGWYAGDLDVRRGEREIGLLMQAEDLYVAMLLDQAPKRPASARATQSKDSPARGPVTLAGPRFYSLAADEYDRFGNALLLFHAPIPLNLPRNDEGNYAAALDVASSVRQAGGWVDAARSFSWDFPLWIAANKLDSVQVANRQLMRAGVVNDELGGRPRDVALYPGLAGNSRWALDIYYNLLNCGVRLPPTAGSGSGWMPPSTAQFGSTAALKAAASGNFNPLGYNRVYVFVDGQLTWDKWWEGLRAGRTVVTNGPLIRPSVEGQPPGYVFQADRGQTLELEVGLTLSTRDKISYLEIIKNGAVEHTVRLDQWKENGGKLPLVKFKESGWFLIRAVTDEPNTYRFAMTAPYYVEIGYQPRISRTSAQFFIDWCRERTRMIGDATIGEAPRKSADSGGLIFANQQKRDEALESWRSAEVYWTDVLKRATSP